VYASFALYTHIRQLGKGGDQLLQELVLQVDELIEGAWISPLFLWLKVSNNLTWWTKTFLNIKYHIIAMYLYNLNFKMWRSYLVSIVLGTSLILTMLLKVRLNLLYHRQLEECVLVTWVLFFWILYLSFILFHLSHTYILIVLLVFFLERLSIVFIILFFHKLLEKTKIMHGSSTCSCFFWSPRAIEEKPPWL
jgi:hypothetical protein